MIIDGKAKAIKKEEKLKLEIVKLKEEGISLKLAVVVFKDDKSGQLYTRLKQEAALRLGIGFEKYQVKLEDKIEDLILGLNKEKSVTGIMIQHPGVKWAKKQGMKRKAFNNWWKDLVKLIDKNKDVDGLRENSKFKLATVKAVIELIDKNIPLRSGMLIMVVGAKGFVGKRLVRELEEKGVKVKGLDVGDDLVKECKRADVLISATGKNNLITAKMIKKGAVVIDLGWPKGDVKFKEVYKKVRLITPVPGGVGPVTVASLLENLIEVGYTTR